MTLVYHFFGTRCIYYRRSLVEVFPTVLTTVLRGSCLFVILSYFMSLLQRSVCNCNKGILYCVGYIVFDVLYRCLNTVNKEMKDG